MRPSITTLFAEEPPRHTAPSAVGISFVVHGVGFFLLFLGLRHTPRMNESPAHERYTVRLLKAPQLERPEIQPPKSDTPSTASGTRGSQPSAADSPAVALPAGSSPSPALPQPQVTQLPRRSQVLIQPDAPPDVQLLQEVPVPVAMIWTQVNLPTKTLVAPAPRAVAVADLRPAIIKPNREPKLADVNISSTRFPASVPVMAASTSPVVMRGPSAPQEMPILSSAGSEQSTPARLLSLSSLKATGDVAIPFANQSAQGGTSQGLAPPRADAANGSGGAGKQGAGKGVDQGTNTGLISKNGTGNGSGSGGSSGGNGGGTASAQGGQGRGTGTVGRGVAEQGLGGGYESSVTRLTMPKDGQFGVVVVGTSVAEEYPEAAEIWHGRLVYTVYLHVGASRNWIMQYSVPASADAAAGGMETKPEAPWPYDILRPHLSENDYTSDALIVHGFVNLAGRFERLGLVFPQGFAQAKFVLDSLMQWKFRPARQGTKVSMVEVLLIIPAGQ